MNGGRSLLFETPAGGGGKQFLLLAFRVVLAAVFIYAALQKIGRPLMFAGQIEMYHVIGYGPLLYLGAIFIPWVELLCGLALLTGIFVRGAALIISVMNMLFIVVIAHRTMSIMSAEGIPFRQVFFDCGCGFGPTYAWKKLIEDAVFLAFSITVLFSSSYRFVIGGRKE